jgi:protein-L-isoaspartate(D-aspartate) O-methyltransferase
MTVSPSTQSDFATMRDDNAGYAQMRDANAGYAQMRDAMIVSQLRTCDVNDPKVLTAFRAVPREAFVPATQVSTCYNDRAVPLDGGRAINPPLVLGRMLIEAAPKATDRVMIIGGGTGYSAAVMAQLAGSIVMVESDAALAAAAKTSLSIYSNITVVEGALPDGHAIGAPYDIILVDGAVEEVNAGLIAQLADDGCLVTGVMEGAVGRLSIGRRAGDAFGLIDFADMEATPLSAFQTVRSFQF